MKPGYRADGTWSCTRDHVTEPCGKCNACRDIIRSTETPNPSVTRHTHEFTLMYWHFGVFGPQDVHIHGCFTEDCWRVLMAKGRTCDTKAKHYRHTLTEAGPSLPPGLRS